METTGTPPLFAVVEKNNISPIFEATTSFCGWNPSWDPKEDGNLGANLDDELLLCGKYSGWTTSCTT